MVAKLPWEGFIPGSGPEAGKTNAKPELFKNMDDVKMLSQQLNQETGKLVRSLEIPSAAGAAFDGRSLYQIAEEHIQKIGLNPAVS